MNILIYDQSLKILSLLNRNVAQIFPKANIKISDNIEDISTILKSGPFDIAVVDIDSMNGQLKSVLNTIHSSNKSAIMITTTSFPNSRVMIKLKTMGINYYFDKHYQMNDLVDILNVVYLNKPELHKNHAESTLEISPT